MSVGDQLGLEQNSELLDQARHKWPRWVAADTRLGVVDTFDDLRPWLRTVPRQEADEVLLALAMLAAPDGGDDVAAAAALAKCLLPGACRLAGWLSSLPANEVFRDSQPIQAGGWWAVERIDELVASQLWMEVRSFPWRRLTKVAANIIVNTKVGVLREVGDYFQLTRADRTWAHTDLVEFSALGDLPSGGSRWADGAPPHQERVASVIGSRPETYAALDPAEPATSGAEELHELLTWACENDVISQADRRLLLCLVSEAAGVQTRSVGRGYGGLIGNELSTRVAPQLGVSQATVRRHASRSVRALAQAAVRFGHGE